MLHPDGTVLLTDALRPPPGYRVDHTVATTYSLTLTAMLIAPMTFTLGEVNDSRRLSAADPIQLLDAVERHVEHTTVFVQAGGIHVPTSHSRIHAFLLALINGERSVRDMARMLVEQRLMSPDEAEASVRMFLARLHEESETRHF